MLTLYRIAFHAISKSYTVQCDQIFFTRMVSMNLEIFNVKHVLDNSKHLFKKYSIMPKVTKTEFCWADDEIQLLLESVNHYKYKYEYQGIKRSLWVWKNRRNTLWVIEAVVRRCSVKKVFLKISQNSKENTQVFFTIKLQAQACNFIKKETLAHGYF